MFAVRPVRVNTPSVLVCAEILPLASVKVYSLIPLAESVAAAVKVTVVSVAAVVIASVGWVGTAVSCLLVPFPVVVFRALPVAEQ